MPRHVCPHCQGTGYQSERLEPIDRYMGLHLSSKEGLILALLRQHFAKLVSKTLIYDTLYGDGGSLPEAKIIDVFICKLRAKLSGGPLIIETHWGRGYSLQFHPTALPPPDHPGLLQLAPPAVLQAGLAKNRGGDSLAAMGVGA